MSSKNKKRNYRPKKFHQNVLLYKYFHLSDYRNFKAYYTKYVSTVLREYFLKLVSCNRFVELMQETLIPLLLCMTKFRTGKCTGIYFIDSTTLDVCHNRRIHSHKVFKGIAERGKSSTGWFYGFKLHLVVNVTKGKFFLSLTPGNVDDRNIISTICHYPIEFTNANVE